MSTLRGGQEIFVLSGEGISRVVVEGSRFLGWAGPIRSEAEGKALLQAVRTRERGARHHPFAMRWEEGGREGGAQGDDGEPRGTGGAPLAAVLDEARVVGALVVVSRYFGGVKLGTGRLARAYRDAAQGAVEGAGRKPAVRTVRVRIELPARWGAAVEGLVLAAGGRVVSRRGGEMREMELLVPRGHLEGLLGRARDLAGARLAVEEREEMWLPAPRMSRPRS